MLCRLTDVFQAAHIRTQHFRHLNATVGLLVVFQHRHQRTANRQAGAVQRVDRRGFLSALLRQRACMRRAWKSHMLEQDEISR